MGAPVIAAAALNTRTGRKILGVALIGILLIIGFLITPLLIFYNIPPAVAVATGANQVIASSFSGALAHYKRNAIDFKLGSVLLVGGIIGSTFGAWIFAGLRRLGQLDLVGDRFL